MTEFAYNNTKNANTYYTSSELNCGYYSCISYEENINLRLKSKSVEKLSAKLRELMTICQETFYHVQELQKQAYDKAVKLRSYIFSNKVWLNSKYNKIK